MQELSSSPTGFFQTHLTIFNRYASKLYQTLIFCVRLVLEMPILLAILVFKVPGDLSKLADNANLSWLSVALKYSFKLYRTVLSVVCAPFFFILVIPALVLIGITAFFIANEANHQSVKDVLTYIQDIANAYLLCLNIASPARDNNEALLLDMITAGLELAPRLLVFSGVDINSKISMPLQLNGDVLPRIEEHSGTPLVMLQAILPMIPKFGEKDDIVLARCVKRLISYGADVNARRSDELTALMLASASGHAKTVELLLQHGADVNVTGPERVNALGFAITGGHTEVIKQLVREHIHIKVDSLEDTSKVDKAQQSELTKLFLSLPEGARRFIINSTVNKEYNILHLVASTTSLDRGCVDLVFDHCDDIDQVDAAGDTIIHRAIRSQNKTVYNLCIQSGADLYLKNKEGETPMDVARKATNIGKRGMTAAFRRPLKRHCDQVSELVQAAQANNCAYLRSQPTETISRIINLRSSDGLSALHWAAKSGHLEFTRVLLATPGINPNSKDRSGYTALDLANGQSHDNIVALLSAHNNRLGAGQNLEGVADSSGSTLFSNATNTGTFMGKDRANVDQSQQSFSSSWGPSAAHRG